MPDSAVSLPRRGFFSRVGAAAAAFGAAIAPTPAAADTSTQTTDSRWQPTRHTEDDWLEKIPGKHRLFFDTTTPETLGDGLQWAGNFFTGNKDGYGLEQNEVAIVICMRHEAAGWGFTDAMWNKYGASLAPASRSADAKVETTNTRAAAIGRLVERGVHFAVCNLSTRRMAGAIARKTGGKQDDLYAELKANMIPNSRLVPAGIVAVNRAQERGYSLA